MQSNQVLKLVHPDLVDAISDPLNQQVLASLKAFAETLALHGYEVPVSTEKSILKLHQSPIEKKMQIRDYFNNWREWITPSASDIEEIHENKEIVFAQRALNHYGMGIDEEFWKTVRPNDVIEIYGEDMIQLYRSLSFFQYCGYSLLDISVYEWYVLWERPRMVIEKMSEYAKIALENNVPVLKFDIPKHVLRETMETGLTMLFKPRACVVQFQNIGSLKRGIQSRNGGFICTAKAEVVAQGDEAMNIQFV